MSRESYMVRGYLPTIGIECHVQLKTKTKLFSSVSNEARQAEPNTLVNQVCFGLPGALPVLNAEAIRLAAKAAYALNTKPEKFSKFDRKHYFYPDLPKGYQITQFDQPVIAGGSISIHLEDGSEKTIHITRAHLEEDAGKSTHPGAKNYSLVDLNRAGTPLLEIVSEPELHSAAEAKAYAKELWLRMKYAGVSDVDLYHGNMRFDVNVSVSKSDELGVRSETKNLNSFKAVERAVDHEINRQISLLEKGHTVIQETRGWLDDKQKTVSQRSKEDAHDYRYFPDPDLPPVFLDDKYIADIEKDLSVMPDEWRRKLYDIGLDKLQTEILLESEVEFSADYLAFITSQEKDAAKAFANWVINIEIPLRRQFISKAESLTILADVRERAFYGVYSLQTSGELSSNNAKALITEFLTTSSVPDDIAAYAEAAGYRQISDSNELEKMVEKVIADNPKPVNDIKGGETKAIGFLVGQVMGLSKGKANPGEVQKILRSKLGV